MHSESPVSYGIRKMAVVIYDSYSGNDGHRLEYYDLFDVLLGATRTDSLWSALVTRKPVLVGALEASSALPKYAFLAVVRTILGRPTAALLFRPLPTLLGTGVRAKVKRLILRFVSKFTKGQTLTILPFSLEPRFEEIATSWIYDPQFWDWQFPAAVRFPIEGKLTERLHREALGRRICVAFGRQDIDKGFDRFVELFQERSDVRMEWLFAFGGKVDARLKEQLLQFQALGGAGTERFVTSPELFEFYSCADLVWCAYHPNYDQASGIFGRAMQLGIPVVVRSGSLIHRFCMAECIAHIAYDGDPRSFPLEQLPQKQDIAEAIERARRHFEQSLQQLKAALGIP